MTITVESLRTYRNGERTVVVRIVWLKTVGPNLIDPVDETIELPAIGALTHVQPGDELGIVPMERI